VGENLKYQVPAGRVACQLNILWFDAKTHEVIDRSHRLLELGGESGYRDEGYGNV
jgi:hypothetical protein